MLLNISKGTRPFFCGKGGGGVPGANLKNQINSKKLKKNKVVQILGHFKLLRSTCKDRVFYYRWVLVIYTF